ncbi:Cation efflux family protein [Corynebacterium capitovis DSM 44611]|uniref:cation diffusion facilitator family transporter n=1 Tax=Corynebacterium capitovis TaxID=131081 RepID=UPI00036F0783|nr:cation diffusion facilitator family transporter [Corynebacterium capitovis]WKD56627.1 Cation efflux family protein [Corynebacterium capitovis DSM 44611]
MADVNEASTGSGTEALPDEQAVAMRKAVRLNWISILVLALTVALVGVVAGQSQAMKTAWYEDLLSFLPPIAFLVATRVIKRRPDAEHPYGHHRAIGVGHVVAASALLAMGTFLILGAVSNLINQEKPPIGTVVLFGHSVWLGWLMVAALVITGIPPIFIGRLKQRLAEPLHDKVLYSDADMNKANWMTSLSTIIGVLGIGVGWWWMDAVAAIIVALSIVRDGVSNLRTAIRDLTDARATDLDGNKEPCIATIEETAHNVGWVEEAAARVRDEGHVFHVELFAVPREGQDPTVEQIRELRNVLHQLSFRVHDVVVAPVHSIPVYLREEDR